MFADTGQDWMWVTAGRGFPLRSNNYSTVQKKSKRNLLKSVNFGEFWRSNCKVLFQTKKQAKFQCIYCFNVGEISQARWWIETKFRGMIKFHASWMKFSFIKMKFCFDEAKFHFGETNYCLIKRKLMGTKFCLGGVKFRGHGDIKYRNAGDAGTLIIIAKVRGKCNITCLQNLTGGDAICREMKNEKWNSNPFFKVWRKQKTKTKSVFQCHE